MIVGLILASLFSLTIKAELCVSKTQSLIEKEDSLRERGFPYSYVAGVDTFDGYLALAKSLREAKADAHETHIPHFAELIDEHLSFAKSAIQYHIMGRRKRFRLLKEFEEEARARRDTNRVTYRWWVNFHIRLSVLMSSDWSLYQYHTDRSTYTVSWMGGIITRGSWTTNDGLERDYIDKYYDLDGILKQFPEIILIPTIKELGIMAFNKIDASGVYPLGLVNGTRYVHYSRMNPYRFFEHDLLHASNYIQTLYKKQSPDQRERLIQFHEDFMSKVAQLPKRERMMAELVYFILTHEKNAIDKIVLKGEDSVLFFNNKFIPFTEEFKDQSHLLPPSIRYVRHVSQRSISRFASESLDVFNRILSEILPAK